MSTVESNQAATSQSESVDAQVCVRLSEPYLGCHVLLPPYDMMQPRWSGPEIDKLLARTVICVRSRVSKASFCCVRAM